MSTPAGWYDDGSGRQRWWDGAQWTEHFAPGQRADVAIAQRSVFGRPWYWALIGTGLAAILVLSALTAVTAGARSQVAPLAGESTQAPRIVHGGGSSVTSALPLGTDVEATYSTPTDEDVEELATTVRVTRVNLDATAEALAEDPWADLMLEPHQKLAIVELDITNHGDEALPGLFIAEGFVMIEDAMSGTYDTDVMHVALDRKQLLDETFPSKETVSTVAVFIVPDDLRADNAAVRIKTAVGGDAEITYVAAG